VAAKVLVIEDDFELSLLIRNLLIEEGYRVVLARDGEHGLAECGIFVPDLILLDLYLPTMNGAELLRRYRAKPYGRAKVIAISGVTDRDPLAQQVEVDAFIGKPFDVSELLATIARLVGD
jgi:DNA-binding response OmpR family regulator